jgi:hypothetical protein
VLIVLAVTFIILTVFNNFLSPGSIGFSAIQGAYNFIGGSVLFIVAYLDLASAIRFWRYIREVNSSRKRQLFSSIKVQIYQTETISKRGLQIAVLSCSGFLVFIAARIVSISIRPWFSLVIIYISFVVGMLWMYLKFELQFAPKERPLDKNSLEMSDMSLMRSADRLLIDEEANVLRQTNQLRTTENTLNLPLIREDSK